MQLAVSQTATRTSFAKALSISSSTWGLTFIELVLALLGESDFEESYFLLYADILTSGCLLSSTVGSFLIF